MNLNSLSARWRLSVRSKRPGHRYIITCGDETLTVSTASRGDPGRRPAQRPRGPRAARLHAGARLQAAGQPAGQGLEGMFNYIFDYSIENYFVILSTRCRPKPCNDW